MKPAFLRKSLLILICGAGVSGWGALRPEGDKIEFSPPRENLKVPPLTGTDLEAPTFNFQRREPGGSVSDIPSAVALPAPDQVNRMRALQELIEQRTSWARPEDLRAEMSLDPNGSSTGAETELSIDDLFDRRTGRSDRGFQKSTDTDSLSPNRNREDGLEGTARDRRGLNSNDLRERGLEQDLGNNSERGAGSLTETPSSPGELGREGVVSERGRGDAMGPTQDLGQRSRRAASEGQLEFGSLVPQTTSYMKDTFREGPSQGDRMDSLRRVLGGSAPSILGASGTKSAVTDGLYGAGLYGTLGAVPGANRNLSQSLDSRPGFSVTAPTAEGPGSEERVRGAPNRPFGLDLTTGREGFSSRSDRTLQAPPPPTPMEMFRKKHDPRFPTRDF